MTLKASKRRNSTRIKSWSGTNNGGFTLIEVLVATLVLSAVVYLSTLSYSLFLDSWEKQRFLDDSAIQQYRSRLLVRNAVESIYDYHVTDQSRESGGRLFPFFKGEKDAFGFITLSSVFEKGRPAVGRIRQVREGDEKYGNLIYEEASLKGVYIRHEEDRISYDGKIELYRRVVGMTLKYYGAWEYQFKREVQDYVMAYQWQETFHGKRRNAVPEIIEMTVEMPSETIRVVFHVKIQNSGKGSFFNPEAE